MNLLFLTGLNPAYSIDVFCILEAAYPDPATDQGTFCRAFFDPKFPPREIYPILQSLWINRFFYPDLDPKLPEYSYIPDRRHLPWSLEEPKPSLLSSPDLLANRCLPHQEYHLWAAHNDHLPLKSDYSYPNDHCFAPMDNEDLAGNEILVYLTDESTEPDFANVTSVETMYARPLQCTAYTTYEGFSNHFDNTYKYDYFPRLPTPAPIVCSDHIHLSTGVRGSGVVEPRADLRNIAQMHLHHLTLANLRSDRTPPDVGHISAPTPHPATLNLLSDATVPLLASTAESTDPMVDSASLSFCATSGTNFAFPNSGVNSLPDQAILIDKALAEEYPLLASL
jgi:hypothetical protein